MEPGELPPEISALHELFFLSFEMLRFDVR